MKKGKEIETETENKKSRKSLFRLNLSYRSKLLPYLSRLRDYEIRGRAELKIRSTVFLVPPEMRQRKRAGCERRAGGGDGWEEERKTLLPIYTDPPPNNVFPNQ